MFYNVLQRPSVNMDGYGMPVSFGTTLPTVGVPVALPDPIPLFEPVTNGYVAESWDASQHWSAGADKIIPADAYQSDLMVSKNLIRDKRRSQMEQMRAAQAAQAAPAQSGIPGWVWIVGLGLGAYAIFGKK